MDFMRSQLHSLLGQAIEESDNYWDKDVCRHFLCGFCPHELFSNTKFPIGDCPRKHSETLRKKYEESGKAGTEEGFEMEFLDFLEEILRDCEHRVTQARKRVEESEEELKTNEQLQQLDDMNSNVSRFLEEAERLGEEGNFDEAIRICGKAEELKKERDTLAASNSAIKDSLSSGNQHRLRVCEVCSAFLSLHDSDKRLADHFGGKQHLGFLKIREKVAELRKMKEQLQIVPGSRRRRGSSERVDDREDRGGRHDRRSYKRPRY